MNRGGIPLPPIPQHGHSYHPQQLRRQEEAIFHGDQQEQYANLSTTVLPEHLQQKVMSSRSRPGPKTTGHHQQRPPSPPPLPPPKFLPSQQRGQQHDDSPEQYPPIPPFHPAQPPELRADDSDSASNSEPETPGDYVEVEHGTETTAPERHWRPYPYELSKVTKDLPKAISKSTAEDSPRVPVEDSSHDEPDDKQVQLHTQTRENKPTAPKGLPLIQAHDVIMNVSTYLE